MYMRFIRMLVLFPAFLRMLASVSLWSGAYVSREDTA